MAVKLSGKQIISIQELVALCDERLRDAQSHLPSKRFAAAVYLAGYAIECYLKAAICRTLDLDGLPELFKTHDLGELLLFSGLERQMKNEERVFASFQVIAGLWVMER